MIIRFTPITNIDAPELILSLFELYAFAMGEAIFSDLPIDFDTILQDAEVDPAKYGLEEERDLLREEPVAARQLLEELVITRVFGLFDDRAATFGQNYAFERVQGTATSIKRKPANIHPAALATAWLSFFYAIDADAALDMEKKAVNVLRMKYARVFELVALLACTSIGPSAGWWTGRDWSETTKIRNFEKLCELVGTGRVKPADLWEDRERQAKDAGVDGFLVTTIGGSITSGSICIALGVTVQKKQRQKKKVGKDQRERLLSFYVNRPTISLIGAAADPYPHEPVLAQDYAAADCLYLHGETLWNLLRLYTSPDPREALSALNFNVEVALKSEMFSALSDAQIIIGGIPHDLHSGLEGYAPAA